MALSRADFVGKHWLFYISGNVYCQDDMCQKYVYVYGPVKPY